MQTEVLGRGSGEPSGPTGRLGHHRARDGSRGAPVDVDLDRPHATLVVGKRGYGKSYTLGVLAEAAARADGVAPVVIDPMGVFRGLAADCDAVPARVVAEPTVRADAVPPRRWPALVGSEPDSPVGALVWHAAAESETGTLAGMRAVVEGADATSAVERAATNRLRRAAGWGVFDPDGLDARELGGSEATVLDCSGLDDAASNAVVAGVAAALYAGRARASDPTTGGSGPIERLPWLFVDEAHVFFEGVACGPLRAILTRGRAPGVSLVTATQRPSALPDVAVSQSDLRIVHRLTAGPDVRALAAAEPAYVDRAVTEAMPTAPGEALVVDDTAESVRTVAVRERDTPHGGDSPRASAVDASPATS
ncbi:ATP-binding protein [Halobellus rubicundus]|uniref:ATP-binding protein n=1 Tax=Halobellus rubicundus TaxID=2996466 RepID=A0ABD5MFP8_9EURY